MSAATADLDIGTCLRLLSEHRTARIAWAAADGPQLFPISYQWHEGRLVFRTSPYGVLSELVRRTSVVVEVDELDVEQQSGWSVLIRGRTVPVGSADLLDHGSPTTAPKPWAGGRRDLVIAVSTDEITGRSFGTPAAVDIAAGPGSPAR